MQIGHSECEDKTCPRNLPNDTKHLIFRNKFSKFVDKLPNSLTQLTFGYKSILNVIFNKEIKNLSFNLKKITYKGEESVAQKLFNKLPFECKLDII